MGGEAERSGDSDGRHGDSPKLATPEMLDVAHAWWQTNRLLQRTRRDIEELPRRIANLRANFRSGGRYAALNPQHLKKMQQDLEAAKTAAPRWKSNCMIWSSNITIRVTTRSNITSGLATNAHRRSRRRERSAMRSPGAAYRTASSGPETRPTSPCSQRVFSNLARQS